MSAGGRYAPRWVRRAGNGLLNGWAILGYVYLFAPIVVIVIFSFNDLNGLLHPFNYTWRGFTFSNWAHPGKYPELGRAMVKSLQIALVASLIATAMGSLVAIALSRYRFRGGAIVNLLLVLPLTTPEICLGSSLLTLFLTRGIERGFTTILIAHVMFCVSFVALTVKARIRGFDWTLEDAAMDLGARPLRTFRKVTMPLIMPGVIAAFMLSISLSIDDYIITVFNSGNTITFPIQVYNQQKLTVPPQIDVLASMILLASILLIGGGTAFRLLRENRLRAA
ncbi:MAG: spermidine/putrescine transport system permease protein [Actinomycetota bacterium]|jgi:spermidine/putrescine transport system permease protein|nr:spermidine/putrescine transport system permease protein [Actinomycetota bacterium]